MMRNNKRFRINRNNKRFLGVCAGIADYLGVAAVLVRIVFVVSFLMGIVILVPAYFVCYFFMDSKSGEFKEGITQSTVFKHFKNVDYKKNMYRNTQDAKILGVCAGVADYFEIDVTLVRVITGVSIFFAGPLPWLAYFAAYFILDKKPLMLSSREYRGEAKVNEGVDKDRRQERQKEKQENAQRERFKQRSYSRRREFQYCARKFSNLHDRLTRMEAYVTSKQFNLHQQFKELS